MPRVFSGQIFFPTVLCRVYKGPIHSLPATPDAGQVKFPQDRGRRPSPESTKEEGPLAEGVENSAHILKLESK